MIYLGLLMMLWRVIIEQSWGRLCHRFFKWKKKGCPYASARRIKWILVVGNVPLPPTSSFLSVFCVSPTHFRVTFSSMGRYGVPGLLWCPFFFLIWGRKKKIIIIIFFFFFCGWKTIATPSLSPSISQVQIETRTKAEKKNPKWNLKTLKKLENHCQLPTVEILHRECTIQKKVCWSAVIFASLVRGWASTDTTLLRTIFRAVSEQFFFRAVF